jgi:dTDP-4-dehydrorhamnose reductase
VRIAPQLAPNFQARGLSRSDVDLLDFHTVRRFFEREQPRLIIHCAAQSNNVTCEQDPALAQQANVDVTRHLADLAVNIPFIFFSTDLIFDGTQGNYLEDDTPNPLSTYGRTKLSAEQIVRRHPQHTIVRISLTGGHSPKGNRGFNEEIKNAWRAGRTLSLFIDEFRCPSTADVVAKAVWELAAAKVHGTFHICGSERLSRFRIGELLAAKHPELDPKFLATSLKDCNAVRRPPDTSMNCGKIQKLLSFEIPRFSDWLARDSTGF